MNDIFEPFSSQFFPLLFINTLFLGVLLRGIFFRHSPKRNSLFGFFMFGTGVFLLTHLLQGVEISMGFAFGLFAIFAMLRYRTESISIRDMTYLFLVIVISLLNGVGPLNPASAVFVNGLLCLIVAIGETSLFAPRVFEKNIRYENIHNIRPENYHILVADITERTGLDVKNIEITNIDFLNDIANLKVSHSEIKKGVKPVTNNQSLPTTEAEQSA
ncbi:MAG: DUF4956 domain-containing protein [Porticoccaceae bacterium]|nr:DUF4956 domain-containing protein [Porticoccaceae bacterium]